MGDDMELVIPILSTILVVSYGLFCFWVGMKTEREYQEESRSRPIGSDTHICPDGTRISMLNPDAILRRTIR